MVIGEAFKPLKLSLDTGGVWSVTTGPWAPDYYCYQFIVDGAVLADPANEAMKRVATGGAESILHVHGPSNLVWEDKVEPHGVLHQHWLDSRAFKDERRFIVYTPPGYSTSKTSYPVVYLLHGVTEDESAWTTAGKANVILDNLIARHEAVPMIVVMPLGYGFSDPADNMGQQFVLAKQKSYMDSFENSLLDEVMARVESDYRVIRKPQFRAIAGCSMGGAQALYIGLNHPERFGSIGAFSPAVIMYGRDYAPWFSKFPRASRVEVDCGTDDFLLPAVRAFKKWLATHDLMFVSNETAGDHTWNVWRRNLIAYTQTLFKPSSK